MMNADHFEQSMHLLAEAEQLFERVAAGQDAITFGNAALTALGTVALTEDIARSFPAIATRLATLIGDCTPLLARAVEAEIPAREVYFAMDAAEKLVSDGYEATRQEHMLCVALLKLEMTRLVFRGQLAADGHLGKAIPTLIKTKPVVSGPAFRN